MSDAKRKDANTEEIKNAIEECGWDYIDTHAFGKGFPDCIAIKTLGSDDIYATVFIEIKTEHGRVTQSQKAFYKKYPNLVYVVESAEQVKKLLDKFVDDLLFSALVTLHNGNAKRKK